MYSNLLARSNFDALFEGEGVSDDVVRDVIAEFASDDQKQEMEAGRLRTAAGHCNQNLPNYWNELGMPVMRPTVDDYWRQQVKHDAIGDPDFWEWWLRRPDGAYARVKSKSPKLIVGWSGEKRSTTKF